MKINEIFKSAQEVEASVQNLGKATSKYRELRTPASLKALQRQENFITKKLSFKDFVKESIDREIHNTEFDDHTGKFKLINKESAKWNDKENLKKVEDQRKFIKDLNKALDDLVHLFHVKHTKFMPSYFQLHKDIGRAPTLEDAIEQVETYIDTFYNDFVEHSEINKLLIDKYHDVVVNKLAITLLP
jgi:hypothetical protein